MEMNGFQICALTRRVDSQIVDAFRALPVANVSDCMSRMTAGGASLRPYHAKGVLAGPAFTVKTRPGDNLMIHKALHMAKPGDVIVVDAGGDVTNALIGELMVATAVKNGIAGFVMNGAIRDVGYMAIPKGAPHPNAALAYMSFFYDQPPAQHAAFATSLKAETGSNQTVGAMPPAERALMATAPENFDKLVVADYEWIGANRQKLRDRWLTWLSR